MKKILIIIAIIIIVAINYQESEIIIPSSAVRFRIIANSNTASDQALKRNLERELELYLYNISKSASNSKEAQNLMLQKQNEIDKFIKTYLSNQNVKIPYKISIGNNYFPKKEYKGIEYNSGYYDSIVVSLGNAQGLNWWCVIYPPLCLIDSETRGEIEYTTLVKEMLNKYQM